MQSKITISVIIPVYKVEDYITQCLESVCGQTFKEIEIICVYKESNDNTLSILKEIAQQDPRVSIVYRNTGGLGGARNYGMQFAKGEYIAFVDSDDWIASDMLEQLYKEAQIDNTDIVMCCLASFDDATGEEITGDWGSQIPFAPYLKGKSFTYRDLLPNHLVSSEVPVVAWNKLYRREFLLENSLTFVEDRRYEDNPFYYEAIIKAKSLRLREETYYKYRKNRIGSLQGSSATDASVFDIIPVMKKISDVLSQNDVECAYQEVFFLYMLNEFSWRLDVMDGTKRAFAQQIKRYFGESEARVIVERLAQKHKAIAAVVDKKSVKVSVIVPVHNTERYIAECVESILLQSIEELEVICVDDCSFDSSVAVIKRLQQLDSRVHLIELPQNAGAGAARNAGMQQASGEYFFFMDADDKFASEGVLELLYSSCLRNNVLTAGGNISCFVNDDTNECVEYSGFPFTHDCIMNYVDYNVHPVWGFTRFLYSAEVIAENSVSFPEIKYYEDPVFFVRYMSIAKQFYAHNCDVYLYRQWEKGRVFTKEYFTALFPAFIEILFLLKNIDISLYAAEYMTFIGFCYVGKDYFDREGRDNEVLSLMDVIFRSIDFAACADAGIDVVRYNSAEDFLHGKAVEKNVAQTARIEESCTGNAEAANCNNKFVNIAPASPPAEASTQLQTTHQESTFVRRIIKKLLKPLYLPFKRRTVEKLDNINDAIWQAFDQTGQRIDFSTDAVLKKSLETSELLLHSQSSYSTKLAKTVESASQKIDLSIVASDEKFKALSARLNYIDSESVTLSSKMNALNVSSEAIVSKVDALNVSSEAIVSKVGALYSHLDAMQNAIASRFDEMHNQNAAMHRDLLGLFSIGDKLQDVANEMHSHIDWVQRDILVVLKEKIDFNSTHKFSCITDHPVAYDSPDHIRPIGTVMDHTRSPRFIRACEEHFGKKHPLSFLDLGCSAGGIVWDAVLRGHVGVGLEGSDISKLQQRAEWRLLRNSLFTCDIGKAFTVTDNGSSPFTFDVVSAWEVLEHLTEDSIRGLFANLDQHMHQESIFACSISLVEGGETDDGVPLHQTIQPLSWWKQIAYDCGFMIVTPSPLAYLDYARGNGNSSVYYRQMSSYKEQPGDCELVVFKKRRI